MSSYLKVVIDLFVQFLVNPRNIGRTQNKIKSKVEKEIAAKKKEATKRKREAKKQSDVDAEVGVVFYSMSQDCTVTVLVNRLSCSHRY